MDKYKNKKLFSYLLIFLFSIIALDSSIAEQNKPNKESTYSKKGADTCIKCHDEDNEYPVLSIFKTKHGERNDSRSSMAKLQCETCHGPVGEHKNTVKKRPEESTYTGIRIKSMDTSCRAK